MATNGYKNCQRFVDEYEKHELEKQHIMLEAAQKVANGPGKFMKEVLALAKEDGIPVKVLRAALLERKHLKNAAKVRDKLDEELADELEQLRDLLKPVADLPIFGAAIADAEKKVTAAKGKKAERASSVDSLTDDDDPRPRFLKGEDGMTDAERLGSGIKQLPN